RGAGPAAELHPDGPHRVVRPLRRSLLAHRHRRRRPHRLPRAHANHVRAQALHPAPFAKTEVITKQGAAAHWLYLVNEGEVAVRVAKDDVETEVARMG